MAKVLIIDKTDKLKVNLSSIGFDVTICQIDDLYQINFESFEYFVCPVSSLADEHVQNVSRNTPNTIVFGDKSELKTLIDSPTYNVGFSFINIMALSKKVVITYFLMLNQKMSKYGTANLESPSLNLKLSSGTIQDNLKELEKKLSSLPNESNTENFTESVLEKVSATAELYKASSLTDDWSLIMKLYHKKDGYRVILTSLECETPPSKLYENFMKSLMSTDNEFAAKLSSVGYFGVTEKDEVLDIDFESSLGNIGCQVISFKDSESEIESIEVASEDENLEEDPVEKYFKPIIESSVVGVSVVELTTGKIAWQNKAFKKLLGIRKNTSEVIFDYIEDNKADFLKEIISMVESSGTSFEGEIDFIKGNGKSIYCDLRVSNLEGEFICLELADASNKAMLNEITEEHEQFRSQQLEVIENAKISGLGTMIGGISHEINNPLAVICGRIDVAMHRLKNGRLKDDDLLHTFERLKEMTSRMTDIIKHLRTFAFGFSQESITPLSLKEILDNSLFLLTNELTSKNISVDLDNVDENVFVEVGRSSLLQVFFNLIYNSIEAVEDDSPKWIRIEAKNSDQRAFIRIIDSGSGIPPHISEKMMEPFYSTKEIGEGTGLGLSVAKRSLAQYGGDLKFLSEKQNTTFQIELPCFINEEKIAG
jgi:signal transduction histidine kinase